MKVKRIVSNIKTEHIEKADAFYSGILGLDVIMDHGWIKTYGSDASMSVQISIASEGGSGTSVPDLSIEVDDLEQALSLVAEAKIDIEYGPRTESWGVRRFYIRDPFGLLVNVLQHVE